MTVGADGNFTLALAPGRYRFTGRSPKFVEGRVDCIANGDVVIPAPTGGGTLANGPNMAVSVECQRR